MVAQSQPKGQQPTYHHTHMLWDSDRLIQEYSDTHVYTTIYDQASFAPVARLAWLREETINEQVSEQDKDWLTKFNKWEQNQRLDPRDLPQLYDDYIKKDKLEAILGIKVYYYHNDQLGTPNELTNEKGEVIWLADLAAWGNVSKEEYQSQAIGDFEISAEDLQPVRFQGQSFDSETGLHYNRFRYYDPDMGMFISRDPIGLMGGDNVFAYAPNPTGWIDPLGLNRTFSSVPLRPLPPINRTPGYNIDFVKEVGRGSRVAKCGVFLQRQCGVVQVCEEFWCPREPRNQCSASPIHRAIPVGKSLFDVGCKCTKWKIIKEEDAPPGAGYRR